jgi:type III secretory pathway component EscR
MMTVDFAEICNNTIQGSPVVMSLIRMMPVTTSLSCQLNLYKDVLILGMVGGVSNFIRGLSPYKTYLKCRNTSREEHSVSATRTTIHDMAINILATLPIAWQKSRWNMH